MITSINDMCISCGKEHHFYENHNAWCDDCLGDDNATVMSVEEAEKKLVQVTSARHAAQKRERTKHPGRRTGLVVTKNNVDLFVLEDKGNGKGNARRLYIMDKKEAMELYDQLQRLLGRLM